MARPHRCERFEQPWRGRKRCRACGKPWYSVSKNEWRPTMTLRAFADKWLPAISGTQPVNLMRVEVAFPFEWNCYESWNIVYRVTFDFSEMRGRINPELDLSTPVDSLDGWTSDYEEDFCRIDYDAEQEFERRAGRPYKIGDNAYAEMRRIIQS